MIWFALIIPIIAIVIAFLFFSKKMTLWEYAILFFVPLITIFICKHISIYSQTDDTEYWNSYITKATYCEPWNEWINDICVDHYPCGSDRHGHTEYCSRTYDCSYVRWHTPEWEIQDNIGQTISISEKFYNEICQQFGNKTFVDLHRRYHTLNGNAFVATFDEKFDHIIPICQPHSYENRVRCSKAVFDFQNIDSVAKKKYHLFDYPSCETYNYNPILGYIDPNASLKLQRYNAQLGATKKLHMLLLVFDNQPIDAAIMQDNYWRHGNKNEFILCVGVAGINIKWAKVISWTDVETLKRRVEVKVREMETFDVDKVVDCMVSETSKLFVKKSFKQFNNLTVEPTRKAIIITYIITFLMTAGLVAFSVLNDFDRES